MIVLYTENSSVSLSLVRVVVSGPPIELNLLVMICSERDLWGTSRSKTPDIYVDEEPVFDKPENSKVYFQILKILEHAKKNKIFAGIHNGTPEYALKMIDKGFNFVTIGADQRAMSTGAKAIVDKMKGSSNKKEESKAY